MKLPLPLFDVGNTLKAVEEWRRELGISIINTKDFWYTEGYYCAIVDSHWRPQGLDIELMSQFNMGFLDGTGDKSEQKGE